MQAWQWGLADKSAGVALFFRRPNATDAWLEVKLQHVDPASVYRVSYYYTYSMERSELVRGIELERFRVHLPLIRREDQSDRQGLVGASLLVEYELEENPSQYDDD